MEKRIAEMKNKRSLAVKKERKKEKKKKKKGVERKSK
jgi:hypothetical protein